MFRLSLVRLSELRPESNALQANVLEFDGRILLGFLYPVSDQEYPEQRLKLAESGG